jgi:hypothetical protein
MAERELRAAATGVERHDRPVAETDAGGDREVGQPALVLPGDDVEGQPGASTNGLDDLVPVASHPDSCRGDERDGPSVEAASLVRHHADRMRGPLERFGADHPGRLEPSPSRVTAARSTTVRHGPRPSASSSAMCSLIEFVPASMTAYRSGARSTSSRRPAARPGCVVAQAHRIDRGHDVRRADRLCRDRDRSMSVGLHHGPLGQAASDGVAGPPLVDPHARGPSTASIPAASSSPSKSSRPVGRPLLVA